MAAANDLNRPEPLPDLPTPQGGFTSAHRSRQNAINGGDSTPNAPGVDGRTTILDTTTRIPATTRSAPTVVYIGSAERRAPQEVLVAPDIAIDQMMIRTTPRRSIRTVAVNSQRRVRSRNSLRTLCPPTKTSALNCQNRDAHPRRHTSDAWPGDEPGLTLGKRDSPRRHISGAWPYLFTHILKNRVPASHLVFFWS